MYGMQLQRLGVHKPSARLSYHPYSRPETTEFGRAKTDGTSDMFMVCEVPVLKLFCFYIMVRILGSFPVPNGDRHSSQ